MGITKSHVLVFLITIVDLLKSETVVLDSRRLNYNIETKQFKILDNQENSHRSILNGYLGLKLKDENLKHIKIKKLNENLHISYVSHNFESYELSIKLKAKHNSDIQCDSYNWKVHKNKVSNSSFEDCFSLTNAFWYGGAESYSQQFWPINNQTYVSHIPYLSGLFGVSSAVLERYWISSNGVAIIVNQSVPLFVSMNKTDICFLATSDAPYPKDKSSFLSYDVCRINNLNVPNALSKLHLFIINNYFKIPTDIPDDLMFKRPIWSTWAVYKKKISDEIVLDYANQIISNNYTHSQLEIDDKWQTEYGDFDFDKRKFPDVAGFIQKLKQLGYRVTLWVHPFANLDSKNFIEGSLNKYYVTEPDGILPALTLWWDGALAAILDTTNPNATSWFISQLELLKNFYGIDSFKFDAGEIQWLPKMRFALHDPGLTPDSYSLKYSKMASELGSMIEVRVGCQTQDLPIFVRMLDKDSRWNIDDNGLKSVVTTALLMSILGYPYILPDMIGGNAYLAKSKVNYDNIDNIGVYPNYELFIRWAQVTAFMPSMQFSIPPWHYNNLTTVKVNEMCKKAVDLHEFLVYPVLKKYAVLATKTGEPIIRPLWWIDSTDAQNLVTSDEFLVGNDILVAPVLDEGAVKRDIYLPKGSWKDGNDGTVYVGPKWLLDYSAPLDVIPYFLAN